MAWYRTQDGQGAFHVNFGRGRKARQNAPAPCVGPALAGDDLSRGERCGRMSVALCDHPAGRDVDTKPLTCDAPVCDHHRTSVGPNVDHCWRHRKPEPKPAAEPAGIDAVAAELRRRMKEGAGE